MVTTAEIIALSNQRKQGITSGLNQLGNTVVNIMNQKNQQARQAESAANQRQAMNFLEVAALGGEGSEQAFNDAFRLAPDVVTNFLGAQKIKAQALTEADKVGLRTREADLRAAEIADRQEERALKKEAIRIKNLQQEQKLEATETKIEKDKAGIAAGIDSSLDLVTRMLEDKGLDSAVGLTSILPTIAGSRASDFEALHEQLSGQNFLQSVKQMTGMGSLSDAEGKKLAAAAEALSLDQSPRAYRAALNRIKSGLATRKEAGFYNNKGKDTSQESAPKVVKWSEI
jgi:hypothetical protein